MITDDPLTLLKILIKQELGKKQGIRISMGPRRPSFKLTLIVALTTAYYGKQNRTTCRNRIWYD